MSRKIHIANLCFTTTEEDLRALFEQYGEIVEVTIPTEPNSNRPRGYAFIEFVDEQAAAKAKEALHEYEFKGRQLCINITEDKGRGKRGRW